MHWQIYIYTHRGKYILSKFYATYINRCSGKREKKIQIKTKKLQKFNLLCI